MICIVLVAGHGTLLEREIKEDDTGRYADLQGVPKALLPGVGNKCILDFWWEAIKMRQLFVDVFLVTNADKYKYYERWATAHDFPVENIVNDGTTTFDSRLGAVADFELVLRTKNIQDDVMVVAGDMLFQDRHFDIAQVIKYFKLKKGELAIYYEMDDSEKTETRGIVEVCSATNRIERFLEKPNPDQTSSRLASVVFYCFQRQTLGTIEVYLKDRAHLNQRGFGSYMEWLVNQTPVYGMKLPTGFQLIGQVGLSEYEKWIAYFSKMTQSGNKLQHFTVRAYARIGLMGNPSDGYHGKTISLSIANFWAEVTIHESQHLVLLPHPLNDPTEFGSLGDLHGISRKEGYLGGLRLLQATCKKFYQYCYEKGIALPKKNFTLKYDTNIPRQVGLAGSSAIVTATLRCLMNFYNLTEKDIAKPLLPKFVLGVEMDELFIQAGLQDRVIQIYEGLVYMDFNKDYMEEHGHECVDPPPPLYDHAVTKGLSNDNVNDKWMTDSCNLMASCEYSNLDVNDVPNLWLAYYTDPSDSGKIHSNVRLRWNQGDPVIIEAMQQFAELTNLAKKALVERDYEKLSNLMNQNFDLRKSIYGDEALGQTNLKMIQLARQFGSSAKFPGSGGAVIGLCQDHRQLEELKRAFQAEGFVVCDIVPYSP